MGSPIFPVIANIFMEHFEKEALRKTSKKPEVWFHYVDDTFVIRQSRTPAFTISDKEHLQTELNHLKLALQKNGHDKKDIIKTINKHANKTTVSDIQSDERILAIVPYQGITDQFGRILNKHNIRTIFKPLKKIGQISRNSKNQRPPLLSSAGIYKIPCSCGQGIHWRNRKNGQPTDKRTPM
ncbi:PREDICTED: uncharacterized protein LOC108749083 [Trachymyrmex septentrionalis]|uniref:uncharacterized protein LOC108749083 n=1 Tax=Trachymyrmex septentrionalis TaxID=34720 RepID=UPI00084F1C9C|nr:PREDICTED: uncharacterized protein LOC108749083 [Trachymyrmex septentrionalis]